MPLIIEWLISPCKHARVKGFLRSKDVDLAHLTQAPYVHSVASMHNKVDARMWQWGIELTEFALLHEHVLVVNYLLQQYYPLGNAGIIFKWSQAE